MSIAKILKGFAFGVREGVRNPIGTVFRVLTDDPSYGFQYIVRELADDGGLDVAEVTDEYAVLRHKHGGHVYAALVTNRTVLTVCGRLAFRAAVPPAVRQLVDHANREYPAVAFEIVAAPHGRYLRGSFPLGDIDGPGLRRAVHGLVAVVAGIEDAVDP